MASGVTNPSIAGLGNRLFVSSPDTGYLEVIDRTNGQSLFVSNDQEIRFRRMVVEQGNTNDEFKIYGANQTGSFLLVLDINLSDLNNVTLGFLRPDQQGGQNPDTPLRHIALFGDFIAVAENEDTGAVRVYNKNTFTRFYSVALPGSTYTGLKIDANAIYALNTAGSLFAVNYTSGQPFDGADLIFTRFGVGFLAGPGSELAIDANNLYVGGNQVIFQADKFTGQTAEFQPDIANRGSIFKFDNNTWQQVGYGKQDVDNRLNGKADVNHSHFDIHMSIDGTNSDIETLTFQNLSTETALQVGELRLNNNLPEWQISGGTKHLVGQQLLTRAINRTGAARSVGDPVYISGVFTPGGGPGTDNMEYELATRSTPIETFAVASCPADNDAEGCIITKGIVRG